MHVIKVLLQTTFNWLSIFAISQVCIDVYASHAEHAHAEDPSHCHRSCLGEYVRRTYCWSEEGFAQRGYSEGEVWGLPPQSALYYWFWTVDARAELLSLTARCAPSHQTEEAMLGLNIRRI